MSYIKAFDLLSIRIRDGGASGGSGGGGGGGGDPYSPLTGWATADTSGNSSIATSNRARIKQRTRDKTQEMYEREQGADGKSWDELSEKEKKEQEGIQAPYLSSAERSNKNRADTAEKKADEQAKEQSDAETAVRNYVSSKEAELMFEGKSMSDQERRDMIAAGIPDSEIAKQSDAEIVTENRPTGSADDGDKNRAATMSDVTTGDAATLASANAYSDSLHDGGSC